jgi:hypothetical protein
MKHILFLVFVSLLSLTVQAQDAITGQVVDSLSGRPLEGASVMLKRQGKTVTFSRTDKQGRFSLHATRQEGDQLQAVIMGYGKQTIALTKDEDNVIALGEQSYRLKEVTVKGSPVLQRKDTITYDLTRYANERDNTLKDVLKKLPGVKVAKSGEISYNGKPISRFTVEGLDLSKGNYNKLTDNIRAKDVKKAEVVNHDQPVKALRNRVFTDDVAMNITLKDSARGRLIPTLRPYVLVGEPTHMGGDATALQIGKQKQLEYTAQYDRTGRDLEQQNMQFYNIYGRGIAASLPQWFSVPSLLSPIDDERLRFNTSQAYSIDQLSRTKSGSENSLSVGYIRTVTRQHTSNSSLYYLDAGPALTTEDRLLTLRNDKFDLELNHTINADTHYGSLTLKADAAQSDGLSELQATQGATRQRVRNPQVNVKANIQEHYTKGRGMLDWSSIVDYHYSEDALYVEEGKLKYANNLWHTNHSLGYSLARGYWNYNLSGNVEAENLNVAEVNNTELNVGVQPSLRYKNDLWRFYLSVPLKVSRFTHQQQTMLLPSPTVYLSRDNGNRSSWSATLSYAESAGGWSYCGIRELQTDYRTYIESADFMPRNRSLLSQLDYKYKRTILHFFFNAKLLASRTWRDVVSDMQVSDGNYYISYLKHNTQSDMLQASSSISKGFFSAHLKTSLDAAFSVSRGEQYSAGHVIDYRYNSWSLSPSVVYSPSFMEITYEGNFGWNRSKMGDNSASTLFDWTQRLQLISTIGPIDLTASGVLYHNDMQQSPSINTFLMDASAVWRLKGIRIRVELRNLFNKKEYATTTYSGVGIFTNSYQLRPREFLLSVQFNLGRL